jgi:predicted regulator of Ras-like GTPase activity (Roadblock/LC7/MglB family)
VPVVILTGFGDMDAVIGALRSGVADFLKKPFSIDEVLSVVRRELAKGRTYPLAFPPARSAPQPEKPPRVYIFAPDDLEQIDTALSKLRAQAGADSALLVEQAGYVITAKGLVNNADLETISSLIAGARSTSASLASLLGESQDFSTSYMEGQRVSVYNTALGRGLYLVVIVPKGTKQGLVWLYAKEAAVAIDRIVRQAAEAIQKQVGHSIGAVETEALHQEMADQKVENVFERKSSPPTSAPPLRPATAPRSSVRPLGTVSTTSFKKRQPAPEASANHAPPPAANSLAPSPEEPAAPSISLEEALKMGLLNFDGAPPPAAGGGSLPDLNAEAPAEEPAADTSASALTPDSFADALKRGLFDFGSD